MISVKIASIIATAAFVAGSFFAPPVQEAIAAVIATDVQCTGCVDTPDLRDNAVTSAKIKDGEVKTADLRGNAVNSAKILDGSITAADIGTDAVGASELQNVTKLIFTECTNSNIISMTAGSSSAFICNVAGLSPGDDVVATYQGNGCLDLRIGPILTAGQLQISLKNECASTVSPGTVIISVIVYAD